MSRRPISFCCIAIIALLTACKRKEREPAASELIQRLAKCDTLSQTLLTRNQTMSAAIDSLIIEAINDHFSTAQQEKILQDTGKMDDYRRWVEESEEVLSTHGAATAAMIQEVAAAKSRVEPFIARNAPVREWVPEIEAQLELLKAHTEMAREAENRYEIWRKNYIEWLEKLKLAYPPDTIDATP